MSVRWPVRRSFHPFVSRLASPSVTNVSRQGRDEPGNILLHIYKLVLIGGEFQSVFLDTIKKKHNIHWYTTHVGPHNKVSIIERSIRSAKSVFFRLVTYIGHWSLVTSHQPPTFLNLPKLYPPCIRLLLSYKTTSFQNLIKLTEIILNHRPHSGIHKVNFIILPQLLKPISHNYTPLYPILNPCQFTPARAHFDSHIAAKIAQLNSLTFQQHQFQAMTLFSKTPKSARLEIGDKVRLRLKDSIFRKESPIANPRWSDTIHSITDIDTKTFPYLISVTNTKKKFYAFQLQKLSTAYPLDKDTPKILVQSFRIANEPYLRSQKSFDHKDKVMYTILKHGKVEEVPTSDLLSYKKQFGDSILAYSSYFKDSPMNKYIV